MKKIKELFTSDVPKNLFDKDENGRDIYYLWYKGGEAFYINKKHETYLAILFVFMSVTALILMFADIYIDFKDKEGMDLSGYLMPFIIVLISSLYILFMTLFKRSMVLYPVPFSERKTKNKVLYMYFCLLLTQASFLINFAINGVITTFTFVWIAYIIFITHFFIRLYKTKGHYFSG